MTSQPFNRNQIVLIMICGIMLVVLFANIQLFDLPPVYARASVAEVGDSALNSLGSIAATTVAQAHENIMASPTPGLEVDEALAILRQQAAEDVYNKALSGQEVVGVYDRVEQAPVLIEMPTWTPAPPTPTAVIDGLNVIVTDQGVWVGPGQERVPCAGLRDGSAYTTFAEWIGRNQHLMDAIRHKCEMEGG